MSDFLTTTYAILSSPQIIWIVAIIMIAQFVRAAIGFGDSVIAVPLLSLIIDITEAVPLTLLLATVSSFVVMWKNRTEIQLKSLKRTTVMALIGFPIGIYLLAVEDSEYLKLTLGLLLCIFAIWYFSPKNFIQLKSTKWSYIFGLSSGVLGGAFGLRGLVFSVYGSMRGWTPEQFKSTIHSFYLTTGILIPFGYYIAGMITVNLMALFIIALPASYIATLMGTSLSSKISHNLFQAVIWAALFAIGALIIAQHLTGPNL